MDRSKSRSLIVVHRHPYGDYLKTHRIALPAEPSKRQSTSRPT
ncbi:MAG: hypothetical protein WA484_00210 [Solirubrobacteraceae bacterium]